MSSLRSRVPGDQKHAPPSDQPAAAMQPSTGPGIPWRIVWWPLFLLVLGEISGRPTRLCAALYLDPEPPSRVLSPPGLVLFILGLVLWRVEGQAAFIGMFVLGLLVFIPGFHFSRIAYLAYRQRSGYTWEDMPEFTEYNEMKE